MSYCDKGPPQYRLHKLSEARRELEAANQLAEKHITGVEEGLHHASQLLLLINGDLNHLHKHSRQATPLPPQRDYWNSRMHSAWHLQITADDSVLYPHRLLSTKIQKAMGSPAHGERYRQ